jgi:hypothetical protein
MRAFGGADLDLPSAQRALAEAFRARAPIPRSEEASALADQIASGNERLAPAEQLEIYREQFFLRHVEVLRDDFGALDHLLGDAAFHVLAEAYLAAHPPSSFSLRDLGARLPAFVAGNEPWSDDPFIADLARVEWAFVEAFDASDAPALDLESVAAVPEDAWTTLRIVLSPFVQRLALGHRAHDYRLAARRTADAENLETLAGLAPPEPRPAYVVVYRGRETLDQMDLDADAFALLDELARGTPLGEACERVAASLGGGVEQNVGAWFREWTTLGWISRVETP